MDDGRRAVVLGGIGPAAAGDAGADAQAVEEVRPVVTLGPAYLARLGVRSPEALRAGLLAWEAIDPTARRGMAAHLQANERLTGDDWRRAYPAELGGLDDRTLRFVLCRLVEDEGAGGAVL